MFELALIYAMVSALTAGIYSLLTGKTPAGLVPRVIMAGGIALAINLFVGYFLRPAIMGSFWGHGWLLMSLAITTLIVGLIDSNNEESQSSGLRLSGFALGLALLIPIGTFAQWFSNAAGADNAARWGSVLKTTPSKDVPNTDANHMVLVTKAVAILKATQVMGNTGKSTVYKIDVDNGARQFFAGHLYYVFPIIPLSAEAQVGFMRQKVSDGLGYVKVNLEDPNQPAEIVERPLRYRLDGVFDRNALRRIYNEGYSHGELADPTVEIDEAGRPHITVSLMTPAFGNAFRKIEKVITLDMETGQIKAYDPSSAPAWIDRIVPDDYAIELAREWGQWGNKHSVENWNVFGAANQYQMEPAVEEPMLLNTDGGHSVWVIPMTSRNRADNSSVGLLLVDTRSDKKGEVTATFFEEFKGVAIGEDVIKAFQGPIQNLPQYSVSAIQYYRLNGEDAWVAIYEQPQAIGANLYRFAIMPVRSASGVNVSVASDKQTLLQLFNQTIASSGRNGGSVSSRGSVKTFSGTIIGINKICTGGFNNTGVETLIQLQISGDRAHIYQASLKDLPFLGFVKEGQTISGSFNSTYDSAAIRQVVSVAPAGTSEQPQ
jgi:hypothetical protein